MTPQFVSMFDLLSKSLTSKGTDGKAKGGSFSPQLKAVTTVVGLVLVTGSLGAAAVFTTYNYISLVALGTFYGIVLSYPLTRFFAPKIQSLVAAFVGGLSMGNLGSQEATVRSWIIGLAKWIKQTVAAANPPDRLTDAIVYSIWTAILIALAIVAANVYFAKQSTNLVGDLVPEQSPAPVAARTPGLVQN